MSRVSEKSAITDAIACVRTVAALHGANWSPADGSGTLEESVQVLLYLGLSDGAIAAYLLRFNVLQIRGSTDRRRRSVLDRWNIDTTSEGCRVTRR